jgi:hypothetical protein
LASTEMRMLSFIACLAALLATPAWAEEPVGCDKFKWPVEKEVTALRAPDLKVIASGSNVSTVPFAGTIVLTPVAAIKLSRPPEQAPKDGTFAGLLSVEGRDAGTYSVSLSEPAWVDVLQNNQFVKAKAFSGVQGCEGIRKVVHFELTAEPFVVQFSGVPAGRLSIAVMLTAD